MDFCSYNVHRSGRNENKSGISRIVDSAPDQFTTAKLIEKGGRAEFARVQGLKWEDWAASRR
jgi:hypothetical protein